MCENWVLTLLILLEVVIAIDGAEGLFKLEEGAVTALVPVEPVFLLGVVGTTTWFPPLVVPFARLERVTVLEFTEPLLLIPPPYGCDWMTWTVLLGLLPFRSLDDPEPTTLILTMEFELPPPPI